MIITRRTTDKGFFQGYLDGGKASSIKPDILQAQPYNHHKDSEIDILSFHFMTKEIALRVKVTCLKITIAASKGLNLNISNYLAIFSPFVLASGINKSLEKEMVFKKPDSGILLKTH